ncbi:unnamed protein product, partial [Mycena citricolor]
RFLRFWVFIWGGFSFVWRGNVSVSQVLRSVLVVIVVRFWSFLTAFSLLCVYSRFVCVVCVVCITSLIFECYGFCSYSSFLRCLWSRLVLSLSPCCSLQRGLCSACHRPSSERRWWW